MTSRIHSRSGAMKALPDPVRDGDGLERLAELLNMSENGFHLLVAWLVAAFIPDLPHPILAFRGEQGTGKSKAAQMVIGIVDPSGAPKRTAPRDVKSWATQAFNSWALCLDNVSYIPDWLSDALCRAVTGDGIVDRAQAEVYAVTAWSTAANAAGSGRATLSGMPGW